MMNNRDFIAKRAAAYFKPGDVVNLGIGIPSLCGSYAVSGVLFQSENGFIGIGPKAEGLMVNERYANAGGVNFVPVPGSSAFDVAASFCVIRSGRLAATVLGGLQVSADGDLANWATPGRAFGMGGAMDLCNGAKNVIVAMELVAKDGSPKIVKDCPAILKYSGKMLMAWKFSGATPSRGAGRKTASGAFSSAGVEKSGGK